jgi:hypothetical protein
VWAWVGAQQHLCRLHSGRMQLNAFLQAEGAVAVAGAGEREERKQQ